MERERETDRKTDRQKRERERDRQTDRQRACLKGSIRPKSKGKLGRFAPPSPFFKIV